MAKNAIPFFRGQDVVLKVYQNNAPIYLAAKNWTVEENATEINEGVNGEPRDRLDKVTNYYSGSVDVYQTDQEVMQACIDNQVPDDNSSLPLPQAGAVQIRHRDGTRAAYKMTGMKLGPWSENQSGRDQAVMLTLKFRFQYWSAVQSF